MPDILPSPILAGQTAVITGGASGIGKSIVQRFLEAGANCLAADLNEEALAALKQEFAAYGDKLDVVKVDVSDRDAVEGMVDRAVQTFGQMDVIVNNAGIMDNLLPIAEMDDDVWERLMRVNLNSVMYGTRKAVRYCLDRGEGGVIINTASLSGLCAGRGGCAYTASKFAVVGLTKNVAFMYADTGIRCNAICPGNTQTNIGVGMRQPSERGMAKATTGYAGATRSGTPEEISAAPCSWPPTRPGSSTARRSPSTAAGARTRFPRAGARYGTRANLLGVRRRRRCSQHRIGRPLARTGACRGARKAMIKRGPSALARHGARDVCSQR